MPETTKPESTLTEHARGALHALPFWKGGTRFLPLHAKFAWAFLPLAAA